MVAQAKPLTQEKVETLNVSLEIDIDAPNDIAFDALLAEIGPESAMPDGTPMPFKLEAWPGGRWFRDLGNNTGHLWGHVQVIKPPKLLELCGPMFMSYPAYNFIQYRLTPAGDGTHLTMLHRAIGLIPAEHVEDVGEGWTYLLTRIKEIAENLRKTR
jgi:uncharacterized protein YndB with AHSA1/START domain